MLHKEGFVFPFKCACNIMNYTKLNILSIGQTLQKIQTGLVTILTIKTGWSLLNFCQVRQCEFSPAVCMKCEAFYRKPHIVSKTHNASANGSTVNTLGPGLYSCHPLTPRTCGDRSCRSPSSSRRRVARL